MMGVSVSESATGYARKLDICGAWQPPAGEDTRAARSGKQPPSLGGAAETDLHAPPAGTVTDAWSSVPSSGAEAGAFLGRTSSPRVERTIATRPSLGLHLRGTSDSPVVPKVLSVGVQSRSGRPARHPLVHPFVCP